MKAVINSVIAIILLWGAGGTSVYAQTCNENVTPSTPNERFLKNSDGTVIDKYTGLVWMRCSLGQTWDEQGQTCTGVVLEYTWQEALQFAADYTFAGSSAWRVPDVRQLSSIGEDSCSEPSINLDIFPETPSRPFPNHNSYWTASPDLTDHSRAWTVSSGTSELSGVKRLSFFVRLVRPDTIDEDGDGIADEVDNCPLHANANQLNTDGDAHGNACDSDDDGDGIADHDDDNPLVADNDAVTVTISLTLHNYGHINNGTMTPSQTRTVHQGKPLEFTVIADAGYYPHISGCDGSLVGTKYSIAAVNEDCTITLEFLWPTAQLNDTGIIRCANADSNDLDCVQADFPGQDADFNTWFNFTKICNSGEAARVGSCPADPVLGSGENEWGCTRDNITGLMWEVKTDDGGLRDKDNLYSWYNPDGNINGGHAGTENGGNCSDAGNCDTEKYAASVNASGLCGYNDWRLPNVSEMHSIYSSPSRDLTYFPTMIADAPRTAVAYWTSSTSAIDNTNAWIMDFLDYGFDIRKSKDMTTWRVMLVRSYSN